MRSSIILQVIPIVTSIKSLRKNQGFGSGAFGSAPIIIPQNLDPISPPDSYSGVTFDTETKTFDFDAGSTATNYVVNPPNSAVRSPYDSTNQGLQEVNFVLGQDYTEPLSQFQPSEYTVSECAPSNTEDNNCVPGSDDAGLQLSRPLSASRLTVTS